MAHIDFPEVLDSTIMAAFRSCPRKAYLEFLRHYKLRYSGGEGGVNIHLHAGQAYAAGLEAGRRAYYEQKLSAEESAATAVATCYKAFGDVQAPDGSPKSAHAVAGAVEYYFSAYPLGSDQAVPMIFPNGRTGIEFSFAEPLDILHPVTRNPLIYCGRLDMCVDYQGLKLGLDDKTTSQLGASWPRQWDLRSQFTGYVWGTGRAGVKLDGFLVRGVAIKKSGYDTLEAITYRPQWQIDRWYEQLMRDIQNMIAQWEAGYFNYNLDHACNEYGGCPFRQVCLLRDADALLAQQFERRQWDPLRRIEIRLED